MLIKLIALMLLGVIALVQHYRGNIIAANWLYLVFDVGVIYLIIIPLLDFFHRAQAGDVYSGNDTTGDSDCCRYGGAEWLNGY